MRCLFDLIQRDLIHGYNISVFDTSLPLNHYLDIGDKHLDTWYKHMDIGDVSMQKKFGGGNSALIKVSVLTLGQESWVCCDGVDETDFH